MESLNNPENLLFKDLEGKQAQLQDVIDDGLEGEYEHRVPALVELLDCGEPYYQLLACVMLTSWGNYSGFQKLIDWASNPENIPWKDMLVVYERISEADSAFEMLADGLKTSFYCQENQKLEQLQIEAIKALLSIYHQQYFGRTLALAIVRNKSVASNVKNEIIAAIKTSMAILQQNRPMEFDLAFQVASLLTPLAHLDDRITAFYANQLINNYSQNERVLRELTYILGGGKSSATFEVLQHLKNLEIPHLKNYVENAMARRLDH